MTTITVSEEVRRQLLRVGAELQARRGERTSYDDVLRYLILKVRRDKRLLRLACTPTGIPSEELRKEILRGRREDERRSIELEERYLGG